MQFHIRTLIGLMALVSLLCGVVFAAPPIVATPILIGLLWISPALWINGIVYGRGAWRPFFIGGTIAGLAPHLVSLYFANTLAFTLVAGEGWSELLESDERWPHLWVVIAFLAPGPFSLLGGLLGVWTWWMFQPGAVGAASIESAVTSPSAHEYLVLSGRLTAVAPHEQPASGTASLLVAESPAANFTSR